MSLFRLPLFFSILLSLLVWAGGCTSSTTQTPFHFSIYNPEILTLADNNYQMSFSIAVENKENTTQQTEAMGVEIFANGLKIGENYCLLTQEIQPKQSANFPITIVFNKQDLGLKKSQAIDIQNINITGQLRSNQNKNPVTQHFMLAIEGLQLH